MDDLRGVVRQEMCAYGHIRVKLRDILDERQITRNRLSMLTGSKYEVITRYYKGENIIMADLDLLARICYVLNCKIEDILEYSFEDEEANEEADS